MNTRTAENKNDAIDISADREAPQCATLCLSFEAASKFVDYSVPLRRPKKRVPSPIDELQQELDAWDAASDEAYRLVDGTEI